MRFCFTLSLLTVTAIAQEAIVIKAARLIDGTGAAARENVVIVVRGDRIEAVGSAASMPIPSGTRVIDLGGDTVLPGLINGHDHPTVRAYTGPDVDREGRNSLIVQLNEMGESPGMQVARGVRDLRVDLLSGVTSEYVVGELHYNDIYLKRMIDAGVIPGPRMYPSGPWIMPTSGYDPIPATDGPWALRVKVRKNVEAGAHHVKILLSQAMATGPSSTRRFAPQGTNFSKEELEAVVDEAHRLGIKVTAHASDATSIRMALEAGCDSIQHATALTQDIIDAFLKHRASIVNTYAATMQTYFTTKDFHLLDTEAGSPEDWIAHSRRLINRVVDENPLSRFTNKPMQQTLKERYTQLRAARDAGIPIAVGTDNMQGLLNIDIDHLVDAGFTPLQAITAATGVGAKALGIDQEVGTLEKGKYADIISVKGNPDQNIRDLDKVHFIMVGGKDFTGLSFR
jgi:imidazolonepropionase-like amidohydrolase